MYASILAFTLPYPVPFVFLDRCKRVSNTTFFFLLQIIIHNEFESVKSFILSRRLFSFKKDFLDIESRDFFDIRERVSASLNEMMNQNFLVIRISRNEQRFTALNYYYYYFFFFESFESRKAKTKTKVFDRSLKHKRENRESRLFSSNILLNWAPHFEVIYTNEYSSPLYSILPYD